MKKMKKILALVMAMAMVLGMSVTALAANKGSAGADEIIGTKDDTGTITITGVTPNPEGSKKDLTVTAYRIIKAKYETNATNNEKDNGNFSGYANVYTGKDSNNKDLPTFVDEKGNYIESNMTQENLAQVYAYIGTDGALTSVQEQEYSLSPDNAKTSYSKEGVPVGTYLVVIKNAESKIYGNMVVSVKYVNENNEYGVDNGTLTITSETATAKVQDKPDVTKEIIGLNGTEVKAEGAADGQKDENKVVANTANVGDILQFKITAPILNYGGPNPVFKVTDDLVGLTYKYDISGQTKYQMKVVAVDSNENENEITDYKIENLAVGQTEADLDSKNQIVLNFVTDQGYILKDYVDQTLVITYYATVDSTAAKYNMEANKNTVKLDYTHNSNVSGTGENETTPGDETKTYTFDLSGEINGSKTETLITKKDGSTTDTTKEALAGAEFMLYQKDASDNIVPYTNATITERAAISSDDNAPETAKVVSSDGNDGVDKGGIVIRGLAAGTYYLKEIKAPKDYSLSDHEYVIVVAPTFENKELKDCTITVDGQTLFKIEKDKAEPEKYDANGVILNTKLSSLPSTGGIGTTIFTIGGCAIMIIAAGLYFASRRKSAK